MISFVPSAESGEPERLKPSRLRRDGLAILPAAGVTIALELGSYFLARSLGRSAEEATVVFLATVCLWLAMAPAALGSTGRGILSPLLRGGITADATGLCVLLLWLVAPCVGFFAAVKIYCLAWSMALAGIAAVWIARNPLGRLIAVVVAVVLFALALTSLLWLGAGIGDSPDPWDTTLATWATAVNPFCAMTAVVAEQVHFVWHERGRMYSWSPVGEYAMPAPTEWYETCLLYLSLAAGLACAAVLRNLIRRFRFFS